MHYMKKKAFFSVKTVGIMPLLSILLIFSISCEREKKVSSPPEKITIAYTQAATAILVAISFSKGYFAEEGLDALAQPQPFGKLALASVLEGKADLATVADTPIVLEVMNGNPITTVATIQTSNRDAAIIAVKDRGILSPADLKGKKIGVTLGTSIEFFVDAYLIAHDISRETVTIVDMRPAEMAEAIRAGRVDAVATFNPTLVQLERDLGKSGTFLYDESVYTEHFCVVGMQEYVKHHPEVIKKFLKALVKAETLIDQNPERAKSLVVEFLKIDRVLLDDIWPIYKARVTLGQALLVNLEDQTRWAVKKGLTTRKDMPNYLDFIYIDGLMAVKPEAVTILR